MLWQTHLFWVAKPLFLVHETIGSIPTNGKTFKKNSFVGLSNWHLFDLAGFVNSKKSPTLTLLTVAVIPANVPPLWSVPRGPGSCGGWIVFASVRLVRWPKLKLRRLKLKMSYFWNSQNTWEIRVGPDRKPIKKSPLSLVFQRKIVVLRPVLMAIWKLESGIFGPDSSIFSSHWSPDFGVTCHFSALFSGFRCIMA